MKDRVFKLSGSPPAKNDWNSPRGRCAHRRARDRTAETAAKQLMSATCEVRTHAAQQTKMYTACNIAILPLNSAA
jgi:hypothetical protein